MPTFARDMAFTPDGSNLVVVNSDSASNPNRVLGRVDLLHLDPTTGALTEVSCDESGTAGCGTTPIPDAAAAVAISTDGQTAYIGGSLKLRAYTLTATGLTAIPGPAGCISELVSAGCALLHAPRPFEGFSSLSASADGRSLYGAGWIGLAFNVSP
jgi:hypothetical protein